MGAYENQAMEAGPAQQRKRKKALRMYSAVIRVVVLLMILGSVPLTSRYIHEDLVRTAAQTVIVASGILIFYFCCLVSRIL